MHEAGMECISFVLQCVKPSRGFHKLMLGDSVSCRKKERKEKERIFELFQGLENFISAI